ncbi:HET-domain-containing protein, partial [Lojkania enalia]
MARFQYNTLPLGEDEIRLLKLLPESMPSTFQPVKTELIRCNIDRPPTFKALSYMWGDEDNRRDIEVGDAMLSITASLDMALRALRSQTEQVLFWIDQICINQNDTAEKNLQIPLMTRIYTIAIQTVGWIG